MSDGTTTTSLPDGRDRWPSALRPGRKMSLGVMIPISEGSHFGGLPRFKDMLETTRVAQDAGFDVAWFADPPKGVPTGTPFAYNIPGRREWTRC